MTTRLALIRELYAETPAEQRCPHLVAPDAEGCRCRQLAGTADRLVCDHFSVQLWCLAGPERWPVCVHFSAPGDVPEAANQRQRV
jgi:hypothetical protein